MKKIRIGYLADGPWSHLAFEYLITDNLIEIVFIVPRTDTNDSTLKKFAQKYNIKYLHPISINSSEFIEIVKACKIDLLVSMSFNQIFKSDILKVPKFGVINCHAGKLPFYRGRNILNWALINDEKDFGITVHFVDEGIDTGDIIKQQLYSITDADDYNSLLNLAYVECAKILYSSIKEIQNGNYRRIVQSTIHPVGFYCGKREFGDEIIYWNQSSRRLFNFIRAICKPGPMATTTFNGQEVKINKAIIINQAPTYIGTPGQLIAKTKQGFLIKTSDSFIEISEIETNIKLKVGDKLGR